MVNACESDDNPPGCGPIIKCGDGSMGAQSVVHFKADRCNPEIERCGLVRSRVVRMTASCMDWLLCMWTLLLMFPGDGDTMSRGSMLHLGGKIRETMWSMFRAVLELSDWGDFWIASIKSRLYVRGCDVEMLSWFGFAATWRRVESLLRWPEEGHRPLSVAVTALSAYMRHYWCQWDNLELRA